MDFPGLADARAAVKRATTSRSTANDQAILVMLGFGLQTPTEEGDALLFSVTAEGDAFDLALNVHRETEEALRLFRDAYERMEYTQLLVQSLHGKGPIPVGGGLHLLQRHGVDTELPTTAFRKLLSVLNSLDIVAYSKKDQTFRITAQVQSGVEDDQEIDLGLRVVDKDRPYSNRKHLRDVLSECKGHIWWVDPHFDKAGLDPLSEVADVTRIAEIRILTGAKPSPTDARNAYLPFKSEMEALGIKVEIRHIAKPDLALHDRFIIGENLAWNVPPLAVVTGKGSYSQFTRIDTPPPFAAWWDKGSPIDSI